MCSVLQSNTNQSIPGFVETPTPATEIMKKDSPPEPTTTSPVANAKTTKTNDYGLFATRYVKFYYSKGPQANNTSSAPVTNQPSQKEIG